VQREARAEKLPADLLRELYRQDWRPNLKILLVYGLLGLAGFLAWTTPSTPLRVLWFACMGYLWMSVVTFMHDASHGVLFRAPWKNWLFGFFATIPILITFISFREDHLEHHRYNRSARDPDAFTMGKRGFLDFLQFYAYVLIGGALTVLQFTIIYPIQKFGARAWRIHAFELLVRVAAIGSLLAWASAQGVIGRFLTLWLVPAYLFTLLNSMRFIGEHYGTPWDQGQLLGTRTITSHPINSFFWNNINYHIGHHVYPATPWYNLQRLHAALEPELAERGALVDASYLRVFLQSCWRGPESSQRNERQLAARGSTASASRMRGSA
jgi:fatty acid desaturase